MDSPNRTMLESMAIEAEKFHEKAKTIYCKGGTWPDLSQWSRDARKKLEPILYGCSLAVAKLKQCSLAQAPVVTIAGKCGSGVGCSSPQEIEAIQGERGEQARLMSPVAKLLGQRNCGAFLSYHSEPASAIEPTGADTVSQDTSPATVASVAALAKKQDSKGADMEQETGLLEQTHFYCRVMRSINNELSKVSFLPVPRGLPDETRKNAIEAAKNIQQGLSLVRGIVEDCEAKGKLKPETNRSNLKDPILAAIAAQIGLLDPKGAKKCVIVGKAYHCRIEPPSHFDVDSFRTVKQVHGSSLPAGVSVTIGCPKGEYDSLQGLCKVGTRAQRIMYDKAVCAKHEGCRA